MPLECRLARSCSMGEVVMTTGRRPVVDTVTHLRMAGTPSYIS
jgi:hypothetical protein